MLDWVRKIDEWLVDLDQKPQYKKVFSFPLERIENYLQTALQDPSLTLTCIEKGWVKKEDIPAVQRNCYVIYLPPLQNPLFFSLDTATLLAWQVPFATHIPDEIAEGFTSYFLVTMMREIAATKVLGSLGMQLQTDKIELDQESYFQFDIGLQGDRGQIWSALFFPPSFRESWHRYFANEPPEPLTSEQKENLYVDLSMQAGHTLLSLQEIKQLQLGDFLFLDHCLYDPETKKGSFLLTLRDRPIFRVKYKDGIFTLADYPPYEEVHSMEEDEDFYDEDEDIEEEIEEDDLFDKEEGEIDEPFEKQDRDDREGGEEYGAGTLPEAQLDEVEVTLVVEVCRLRMSAKELLALSKGNVLDLEMPIEKAVDLVVSGKRIGRAELMRIGDNVGVRILQLTGK